MKLADLMEFEPKPGTCYIMCASDAVTSGSGLIHYPEGAQPFQPFGHVLKFGDHRHDPGFTIGDTVLFPRHASKHFNLEDGRQVAQCPIDAVLCTIE